MKMLLLSLLALILAFACSSLIGCAADSAAEDEETEDAGKNGTADSKDDGKGDSKDEDDFNPCDGKKPIDAFNQGDGYFNNLDCLDDDGLLQALEQSGSNVTVGYTGEIDATGRVPILTPYSETDLCPVNVHWHLGAEHLSVGEFDTDGMGPANSAEEDKDGEDDSRRLAKARLGFRCHHYNESDPTFTTEYDWKHCEGMHVGETYEVHWPHSAAGKCGTKWQYQTPFYDGVFCVDGIISLDPPNVWQKVGVQAQVFTIVNDEEYYYADLFKGMRTDAAFGADITKYTGSTTGTSRSNEICSRYTPITWQVDRKCHLISASSFDKMCEEMKKQSDDMTSDLHAHGSRELVADEYAANNHQRL